MVQTDLWHRLQKESRPILLYGMGNGADKILAVLDRYGVEVADFFASDGFVRGHAFHKKTVLSYSQAKEKYSDFVILLSFATALPQVLERILAMGKEHLLYVPDVPVAGSAVFDLAFYQTHAEALAQARSLFCDQASKKLFDQIIAYKLTGEIAPLFSQTTSLEEMYHILGVASCRTYVDLGAYTGDTVHFVRELAPNLAHIYAMEPDGRNFKKLQARAEEEGFASQLTALQAAAWEKEEILSFRQEGNRNAGIGDRLSLAGGKIKEVQGMPPDLLLSDAQADLIKYDVEGAEAQAIRGSAETIARCRPALLVSLYHRSEDLFALPLQLAPLCPDYDFYLRRERCLPAWDLNLLAVPKEKRQ